MNRLVSSLVVVCALLSPALLAALDKEEKQWVEDVKSLILSEEEKAFGSLKSKEDRAEFQKIFWARRDPDLLTPENEFQKVFEERRAEAKKRYTMKAPDNDAGIFLPLPGDQTDCGLAFIALGEPAATKKLEGEKKKVGEPQAWSYAGVVKADFTFDGNCRFFPPQGADRTRAQIKQARIVQSDVNYHLEKGKLLRPLADMLPKPGPAQALLLQPRTDFEMAHQISFVKIQEGGTGLFGLLRGEASALTQQDVNGQKSAKILLRAEAKGGDGSLIVSEREVFADIDSENRFVASYRLGLRPGAYELKVGAIDTAANKGSVFTHTFDAPNFNTGELTISSLFALSDLQEVGTGDSKNCCQVCSVGKPCGDSCIAIDKTCDKEGGCACSRPSLPSEPQHAYAGFEIGPTRLVPRFGQVFKQSDSLHISYQFYDPKLPCCQICTAGKPCGDACINAGDACGEEKPGCACDASKAAANKPSAVARLSIHKSSGAVTATAPEQEFDSQVAGSAVGPVSLAAYTPGKYKIVLQVEDKVAQKVYRQEQVFEVRK